MIVERKIAIDPMMFRAYDIRGVVGESLTEESVYLIGKALGTMVLEGGESKMAVGRDGRVSGPMLIKALSEGIMSTGCDVIDVGMVPTPVLYYATHAFDHHSGVMLTGSHNPPNYNGLKMVVNGKTVAEERIQEIYQRIINNDLKTGQGCYYELDIVDRYITYLKHSVQIDRPLKVVVDAGNGVTGMMAEKLFSQLGCEVHELFCDVDGAFPNHHPDPSQPENLQDLIKAVHDLNADVGLAFDGDGDRLGVITNKGEVIWPDRLLILYAEDVIKAHPDATIIYDVKCTNHLANRITEAGGKPLMWKTGHSLIKAKMAETKAQLAGEMSGHFFFKDRWYGFDDALYAGARLLEILSKNTKNCDELFAEIPNSINTPELKVFISESEKFQLMQRLVDSASFSDAKEVNSIDGLRVNFQEGWGLVRPSNTTPYLVLRFEAINQAILDNIQLTFREWMLSVQPDLELPF